MNTYKVVKFWLPLGKWLPLHNTYTNMTFGQLICNIYLPLDKRIINKTALLNLQNT